MPSNITYPQPLALPDVRVWKNWLRTQWLELCEDADDIQKRKQLFEKLWNDHNFRQSHYYRQLALLDAEYQHITERQRQYRIEAAKKRIFEQLLDRDPNYQKPAQSTEPQLGGIFQVARNSMQYNSEVYAQSLIGYVIANNMVSFGMFLGALARHALENHAEDIKHMQEQDHELIVQQNVLALVESEAERMFRRQPTVRITPKVRFDNNDQDWQLAIKKVRELFNDLSIDYAGQSDIIQREVDRYVGYLSLKVKMLSTPSLEQKVDLLMQCIESADQQDLAQMIEQYESAILNTLTEDQIKAANNDPKLILTRFFSKVYLNDAPTACQVKLTEHEMQSSQGFINDFMQMVPPPLNLPQQVQRYLSPVSSALVEAGQFWTANMQEFLIGGGASAQNDEAANRERIRRSKARA